MRDPFSSEPPADILIVDDSPANLRLLTQLLQGAGYRVRAVTSGRRGLAAASAATPNLLLLDVHIPDLDGYAVCAQLKADPATAEVPIIFISALDETAAKVSAFAAGAVDYVIKPLQPDEVLARVKTHLTLRDLNSRLRGSNEALGLRLGEVQRANAQLEREVAARVQSEREIVRLLAAERRRTQQLERLRNTLALLSGELDPERVRQLVVEQAIGLVDTGYSSLFLYDQSRNDLEAVAYAMACAECVDMPELAIGTRISSGEGLIGGVARDRMAVLMRADAALEQPELTVLNTTACHAMLLPLLAGERFIGVLAVYADKQSPLEPADTHLLTMFAQQAALVLQNAWLVAELQYLAHTDSLTGLHNRRNFFSIAAREIERADRTGGPIVALMLDIDHFKQINDRFGHLVGDQALRAVADVCRERLRTIDVVARYGGEEFVMLLPDTDIPAAKIIAERLCDEIGRIRIAVDGRELRLTVSLGVAELRGPLPSHALETLLEWADHALYFAKQSGRNQVVVWGGEPQ